MLYPITISADRDSPYTALGYVHDRQPTLYIIRVPLASKALEYKVTQELLLVCVVRQ